MTSSSSEVSSWSFEQLLDCVQCSEAELLEGLQSADAIKVDENSWTVIDPDMRMRIISLICNVISENSWSWDNVPKQEALELIKNIEDENITSQVLDQYFSFHNNKNGVHRAKLCRFYGEYLLQSSSVFNFNEFLKIWQESMPIIDTNEEPFEAKVEHLEGLALINNDQIKYFPEVKLPTTIQDRLSVLFDAKEKWSLQEITPFVINMTTPKLNVKALLTKYARASRVNGQQVFSSKHQH